ncbi:MAG: hypothetical protein ABR898_07495, partial [Terracidiphilus sp.]
QPNSNAKQANTDIRREGLLYAAQASGIRKHIHRRVAKGFLHNEGTRVGGGTSVPTGVYSGAMRRDVFCDQIHCRAPISLSCKMALQGQIGWTIRTEWTARNACKYFI